MLSRTTLLTIAAISAIVALATVLALHLDHRFEEIGEQRAAKVIRVWTEGGDFLSSDTPYVVFELKDGKRFIRRGRTVGVPGDTVYLRLRRHEHDRLYD